MIKQFKKKPTPVNVVQYTPENLEFIKEWSGAYTTTEFPGCLHIPTLEGTMTCKLGDYVIQGIRGEFYFNKKDIFEETYEQIKE